MAHRIRSFCCEQLERRDLLSGGALAALSLEGLEAVSPLESRALVGSSSGFDGAIPITQSAVPQASLVATFTDITGGNAKGEATYFTGIDTTTFQVAVKGFAPNTTSAVFVNGVIVGPLVTNNQGVGSMVLSAGVNGTPPFVGNGTTMAVGSLRGTFAANPFPQDLVAILVPATGSARGVATFLTGASETTFQVAVSGIAPNTTSAVFVNGVIAGPIITNTQGVGSMVLATNILGSPPTVRAGNTIAVGSLSGTFVANSLPQRTLAAPVTDITGGIARGAATSTITGTNATTFQVVVSGFVPNTTFAVLVDGAIAGPLVTNVQGIGALVLSTGLVGSPPAINVGSTLAVGELRGSFVTNPIPADLAASLVDFTGGNAIGSTAFTITGTNTTTFQLAVGGFAPNSTFAVVVDGAIAAPLTTNAQGLGSVVLSTGILGSPPAIREGSFLAVGALRGTFLASSIQRDLVAALFNTIGGLAVGQATYLSGSKVRALEVAVSGFTPNATFAVLVDGAIAAPLITNAQGVGTVVVSPGIQGLPPFINQGSTLAVGPLAGSFFTNFFPQTTVAAALTDSTGGNGRGQSSFTVTGNNTAMFQIAASGLAPNTTFAVIVNGSIAGPLITDAQGIGRLVLATGVTGSPPFLSAGSTVAVGTLRGTLLSHSSALNPLAADLPPES